MTTFYTEVFGLEIAEGYPDHGFRLNTGECTLCLHAGASGDAAADAPKIVFEVGNLEASRSHLLDHGVEVGDIRSPAEGVEVFDGVDPEGNPFSAESSSR